MQLTKTRFRRLTQIFSIFKNSKLQRIRPGDAGLTYTNKPADGWVATGDGIVMARDRRVVQLGPVVLTDQPAGQGMEQMAG